MAIATLSPCTLMLSGEDREDGVVRREEGGVPLIRLMTFRAQCADPQGCVAWTPGREIILFMTIHTFAR